MSCDIDRKAFLLEEKNYKEWNKFVHNCSNELLQFIELEWIHISELLLMANRWEISNNDSQMYSNIYHLSVLYQHAGYSEKDLFQELLSRTNNDEDKEEILEIIELKNKLNNDELFWQFMEYGKKIIFPHPTIEDIVSFTKHQNQIVFWLYEVEVEWYYKERDDFIIWRHNKEQE